MCIQLYTCCGYEVPRGMAFFACLKGTIQLDHNKDVCASFNLHQVQFEHINTNCVQVVALMIHVFLHLIEKMDDQFLEQ